MARLFLAGRNGKKRKEKYKVRWELGEDQAATFAERGHPFVAPLLAGGEYDFANVLGNKPAVLIFWASWCAPCLREAPHLERLYKEYGPRGIEFVALSIDEAAAESALTRVVNDLHLSYPVVLDRDGKVLALYAKNTGIPITFVLDATGRVRYRQSNFQDGDEVALEAALRSVLPAGRDAVPSVPR